MPDEPPASSPLPASAREAVRGFNKVLGFRIAEWRDGFARLEVDLAEHHLNRSGLVHGGVLATLLDATLGYTGVYPGEGQLRRAVTLSMTTSFLAQADKGTLICTAQRRGGGKTIFMATGEVAGPDGTLLAIGEAVYRYIAVKP